MNISKRYSPSVRQLGRRNFLKGLGATIALPFLESIPLASAGAAPLVQGAKAQRLVCLGVALGLHPDDWFPSSAGKGFELPRLLQPLAGLRDQFTLVSGVDHPGVSGGHKGAPAFLSGTYLPERIGESIIIHNSITLDQRAVPVLSRDCRFESLQLSATADTSDALSWNQKGVPLYASGNPRAVFQKLFVDDADPAATQRRIQAGKSVLDAVLEDSARLSREVSKADQSRLDQYMNSIRDVEVEIQHQQEWVAKPKPVVPKMELNATSYHANLELMHARPFLALAALPFAAGAAEPDYADFAARIEPFIAENCARCHGEEKQKADMRFDTLSRDLADPATAISWMDVIEMIEDGEMPPEDVEERPADAAISAFTGALKNQLRLVVQARGSFKKPEIRRLSHSAMDNTVQALTGVALPLSTDLPADPEVGGFDNGAETMAISHEVMRQLQLNAHRIAQFALPGNDDPRIQESYTEAKLAGGSRILDIDGYKAAFSNKNDGYAIFPKRFVAPFPGYYQVEVESYAFDNRDLYSPNGEEIVLTKKSDKGPLKPRIPESKNRIAQFHALEVNPGGSLPKGSGASPPHANVEPLEPDVRGALSIREMLEKHRKVETCNDCHRKIDPLGFALENFDPIGAWRDDYNVGKKNPLPPPKARSSSPADNYSTARPSRTSPRSSKPSSASATASPKPSSKNSSSTPSVAAPPSTSAIPWPPSWPKPKPTTIDWRTSPSPFASASPSAP